MRPLTLVAAAALLLAGCSTGYQPVPPQPRPVRLAKLELAKDKLARLKAEREAKEAKAKADAQAARDAYAAENSTRPAPILEAIKAGRLALGMTQAEAALVIKAKAKTAEMTEKGTKTIWTIDGGPVPEYLGADLAVGKVSEIQFWNGKLYKVLTSG